MAQLPGLYDVLRWVQKEGEVRALERLRLKVLSATLKEKIVLSKVNEGSLCSDEYLVVVRQAASEVVGKPCPLVFPGRLEDAR